MRLEKKMPPPLVALGVAAVMYWLTSVLTWPLLDDPYWRIGVLVFVAGGALVLDGGALFLFYKHKTTVNPFKPENTVFLVDTGLYRYSRNPMYLGMLLWLVAWGIYLNNALALVFGVVAFVCYMNRWQIKPEERSLREQFGQVYCAYCARVRRWL